ncbi:MAG TPA: branched-chain amino acid ABC transporter permease [Candidatus Bathyarchaeia archaeon]|nr:branched-chain amino acid ABC transporter permease [Candidatus Bathyarchaeia archaeon]
MSLPPFTLFGVDIFIFSVDLAILFALYFVVSLSLNLEAGYAGIPNFGKVMFVAGGAAAAGSLSGRLATLILGIDTRGNYNGSIARIINQIDASLAGNPLLSLEILFVGVIIAAAIGAAIGFAASYPAIRLREDYLGMLLLASAQLFQIFLGGYEPLIGGTQGLLVPDVFLWASTDFRDILVLGIVAVFAGIVYVYCESLARSPLGRTLRAIRDNEIASRALGKDDVALRKRVIVIASAISGVAGALLTFYVDSIGAGTWTRVTWTFWPWVIVILGGVANNTGVALGAFSFTFILKTVSLVKVKLPAVLPIDVNWFEYLLFGSLLILVLVVRPGGLLHEKPSLTIPTQEVVEIIESENEESKC